MRGFTTFVKSLGPDEVFVFGSNASGFHGAGSAGFAMRGTTKNTWREDKRFLDILRGRSSDRRGLWAVFGVSRGFQVGTCGSSYAIQTVERPGLQGNLTMRDLSDQLRDLVLFAYKHPDLTFLVPRLGANRSEGGYSYVGLARMARLWAIIHKHYAVPDNLVLPECCDPRPP